tara:strand:+ start:318 stop:836 length:519 start_codon:yes stop_codon:yes gene_type:complete
MVKITKAPGGEESANKSTGFPQGNYNFVVTKVELMVETKDISNYSGAKKWAPYEVIISETGDPETQEQVDAARHYVSVSLFCEGPAVVERCLDSLWLTPKGQYKYDQFLVALGLDPNESYETDELVQKNGVAFLGPAKPNREGKIYLEVKRYFPKEDAPVVSIAAYSDDVPF